MNVKLGERFWFRGDWQTPEGWFVVAEIDERQPATVNCKDGNGGLWSGWDPTTVEYLIRGSSERAS